MMTVVVDQHHFARGRLDLTETLESAIDAFKLLERRNDRRVTDL